MITTLAVIIAIGLLIYFIDCIATKSPNTTEELTAEIKYAVNRITETYDFAKDVNIQSIENLKKTGWYVSDCGEFFHIIAFTKEGEIKLSSASKDELKRWDRTEYMEDVKRRLNKKIDITSEYDYSNNQLVLCFPNHPSKQIKWRCKIKSNGVLIIRKQTGPKKSANTTVEDAQYLWMEKYTLGYDIQLHRFLSDN